MKTRNGKYKYRPQVKQVRAKALVQNQMTQTAQEDFTEETKDQLLNKKLKELYENIKAVPSYSAKITKFLRHNDVHSKFRRVVKHKFPRRRVIVRYPYELFMADTIDYRMYSTTNKNFKYIMLAIDCFTKMIYVEKMKTKNKKNAAIALENIFKQCTRYPTSFVTDAGTEYFNDTTTAIFTSYGINHYKINTKSDSKAMMAERAIRTIKSRIEKCFYKNKNTIWINVLDDIVSNYNKTPHKTTGYAPEDVTEENRDEIFKKMFPNKRVRVVCRLNVGDKVRKIREKRLYEKGYSQTWSDEIYKIYDVRQSNAVCWYKLEALNGERLKSIYYYHQLNLVAKNDSQP